MIRRILTDSLPSDLETLHKVSEEVREEENYQETVKDLIDTLNASEIGVGLAAPQIGISKRIFVINRKEIKNLVCINPEIISAVGRMKFDEGCLSFPNRFVRKTRKQFVKIKFRDIYFREKEMQFSGVDAICIQHELEHLNGVTLL